MSRSRSRSERTRYRFVTHRRQHMLYITLGAFVARELRLANVYTYASLAGLMTSCSLFMTHVHVNCVQAKAYSIECPPCRARGHYLCVYDVGSVPKDVRDAKSTLRDLALLTHACSLIHAVNTFSFIFLGPRRDVPSQLSFMTSVSSMW